MQPQKPRTCDICDKTFKRHTNLVLHQNKTKTCAPGNKIFKCQYCNDGYGTANGLKYHEQRCLKNENNTNNDIEKQIELGNNTTKIFSCQYCGGIYGSTKMLNNHIQKCAKNDEIDNNDSDSCETDFEKKHLKRTILKQQEIIRQLEKEKIEKLENEVTYFKKIIDNGIVTNNSNNVNNVNNANGNNANGNNNNNNIGNNTINQNIYLTAKFIKDQYKNGPPLLPLMNYDDIMERNINNSMNVTKVKQNNGHDILYNKKIAFAETLVIVNKNNRLVEHISDIIVSYYIMDDPAKQSAWSTDPSRLSFIIRGINMGSKDSVWLLDQLGDQLKKIVINPLLKYINEILTLYQKHLDVITQADEIRKCLRALKIITNKKVCADILKNITPKFGFKHIIKP